jgi:pimeloyl-ACP methyl ester carboxylesterase
MEIKLRDLTVHYEEVGSGKPVLILHGWLFNGRMTMEDFEPSFETRPGWRRLYLDLPGHGHTPVPDGLHEHDQVVNIALDFMDTVAPGERFALAGVSWGGYLARGMVHHRPKQVDGVMLYVPAIKWLRAERDLPAHYVTRHDPEFIAALQPGEAWMLDMVVAQRRTLLDNVHTILAYATPQDPAIVALSEKPFSFDPDILPEPCAAPTLFITGRQDSGVGYKDAWSILNAYPRATFAVLDGAGHMLGLEQPMLMRALLNEWLDRVEEYAAQR